MDPRRQMDPVDSALIAVMARLGVDTGTVHLLGEDGALHLQAHRGPIPAAVLAVIQTIPIGKGMAGLAVARKEPVSTCNLQADATGDVRPGARATGLQGAIVVPILRGDTAIGALGVGCRGPREFNPAETALLREAAAAIAAAATAP